MKDYVRAICAIGMNGEAAILKIFKDEDWAKDADLVEVAREIAEDIEHDIKKPGLYLCDIHYCVSMFGGVMEPVEYNLECGKILKYDEIKLPSESMSYKIRGEIIND